MAREICSEHGGWATAAQQSSAEVSRNTAGRAPGNPRDGPVPMPYDMPVARIETSNELGGLSHLGAVVFRGSLPDTAERVPETRGTARQPLRRTLPVARLDPRVSGG